MNDSIDIEGKEFISAKRAARETGYARDYIGQLARGGLIEARRVEGLWYVFLDSLHAYKTKASEYKPPVPPPPAEDSDTTVTFDGKEYVSAARGAKLTGYHQDYVGQLARTGKVESRQVGSRWFIAREALLAHKKQKDALLAAVQAESVGLSSAPRSRETHAPVASPRRDPYSEPWESADRPRERAAFFTYTSEHAELVPPLAQDADAPVPLRIRTDLGREVARSSSQFSPIPTQQPFRSPTHSRSAMVHMSAAPRKSSRKMIAPLAGAALTIVIVLTFGFTSLKDRALYALKQIGGTGAQAASAAGGSSIVANAAEWLEGKFAHDIEYQAAGQ